MTAAEAKKNGYKVIKASPFEVGLTKNGKGIRTWWAVEFGGKMPGLGHQEVMRAIEINEEIENAFIQARREPPEERQAKP